MLLGKAEVDVMIRVGVIDDDSAIVDAMRWLWKQELQVVRLDAQESTVPEDVDVLLADLGTLGGHALRFLYDARTRRPSLPLVVTYLYFDTTQKVEGEVRRLADLCILKPYDLDHLRKSIRHLRRRSQSPRSADPE